MLLNPALPFLLPTWKDLLVSLFGSPDPPKPPPPPPPPPTTADPAANDAAAKEKLAVSGNRGRQRNILAGRYQPGEALGSTNSGGGKTVLGG